MRRNIGLLLMASIFVMLSCKSMKNDGLIPVTAPSEQALALYNEAYNAMTELDIARFDEVMPQIWKIDEDFFMANYLMVIYETNYMHDSAGIARYTERALNTKAKLSKGEEMLKEILVKRAQNRNADISGIANEIIAAYPKDFWGYYELAGYEGLVNNHEGQIAAINVAIEKSNQPAFAYNYLGYTQMANGKMDEARAAFDKYIELAPNQPNPYDSKGDYFMEVKDYKNAYQSYMKAHELDSLWGVKKAEKAKIMMDSTGVAIN
ncbi:MAG TPA: tetratricopeptide repeat protein [Lentimicrobium sp.]|nr:tetratricopeptide repeat protein [Lentimicrobium sp.]